jgi:hypothetical protein
MTKLLINFADRNFSQEQRLNTETGLRIAGFDHAVSHQPKDIDAAFRAKNERILRHARGAGYWLWKPYFLKRALDQLADGDYVFYCDAGAKFLRPVEPLVRLSEELRQDVLVFELAHLEKHWTKRDAFILMGCDSPPYTDTRQRLASFVLCRRSPRSRDFVEQFLGLAQDERLITDLENQLGHPNYDGFIEHRHDQSILSLLSKQHGLAAHRDPSQWGNDVRDLYPQSPYEQLIDHTRRRNRPNLAVKLARRLGRLLRG